MLKALIGYHFALIPLALLIFPFLLEFHVSTFTYNIFSLYGTCVSGFQILLIEFIKIRIDYFRSIKFSLSQSILQELLNIYSTLEKFLNLFGEIIILRLMVSFLAMTFHLFMIVYVNLFTSGEIKEIGKFLPLFFDFANLPSLISLILCHRFNSACVSVSSIDSSKLLPFKVCTSRGLSYTLLLLDL